MATPVNHSDREHAMLSASKAGRWLNCTPSARLEEQFGDNKRSAYADEGTLAHELAELTLRHDLLSSVSEKEFNSRSEELVADEHFTDEMLDMVGIYTDYCRDEYLEAERTYTNVEMFVEQKLDLTEYVPDSFGTADCVIATDGVLEVIDLKYGKGVPVYAQWNKQLMLYGLGALRIFDTTYAINSVKLTIVQPRLDNISSFMIDAAELRNWAETELRPKANLAYDGKGELVTGEWCKFCAVKNRCRALYEECLATAKVEFQDYAMLSDDEIASILTKAPMLKDWLAGVQDYAKEQAMQGKVWNGFKLVEGRSVRKYMDEDAIVSRIFTNIPELSEEDIFNTKLKGITELEKLIGKKKFAELLGDLVVKPQGAPTLVSENDKRPAIDSTTILNDFKEQI